MLNDRIFYPLAFAFIAFMILYSLSFSKVVSLTDEVIQREGYIAKGNQLIMLTASPGTKYEFVNETPAGPHYLRAFTEIARKDAPLSAGIFAALNSDYERAFAGQKLQITIRARQGQNNPLLSFDMGYFSASRGLKDSGWNNYELTKDWKDFTLEFTPDLPNHDPDIDYLGFWPGEEGELKTMDVQSLKINVLSKA